jgi:pimeloyl-ACP methyl ester carboxylesterase
LDPQDRFVEIGFQMHVREWTPSSAKEEKSHYLLVHGLASNASTWDEVAIRLAEAGHTAVALDQRGHGLSDKPEDGYDFTTITQDLRRLLEELGWEQPVLAGQSWGGNVLLEFGARFPGLAKHLVFVDGGFLDLSQRGPWDEIEIELRPPDLIGTPREVLASGIKKMHPNWSEAGIEATLHNFETLPNGTVRPWLTLERHMLILRSMYEQTPNDLFPQVQEPVLICVADDGSEWAERKREQVGVAVSGLKRAQVEWFQCAAHDIHIDQADALVECMLEFRDQIEEPA